jgi:hypothetical protein
MNAIPTSANNLSNKYERACARLAAKARANTLWGGESAFQIAKRANNLSFIGLPALVIVGDIYSASTGKRSEAWEAWECDDCGCAHLGRRKAMECCYYDEEGE